MLIQKYLMPYEPSLREMRKAGVPTTIKLEVNSLNSKDLKILFQRLHTRHNLKIAIMGSLAKI